ncbi:MAG: hypothetical protein ACI9IV_001861 [Paracoccaceae bacterium]|jgi:hypothetical protein
MFKNTNHIMLAIWALLLVAGLAAFGFARWELAFVSLTTLGLSLIPPMLASRWSLTLPVPFLFATTLFLFASIFLGEAFDFYERLWWWDLALHGAASVGFGLTGFLFVFMLFEGDRFAAPPSAIAFITFCVAMTMGAIWEVFEFGVDQLFGLNMQKSGLQDTMSDLMINGLGSATASLTGYLYLVRDTAGVLGHGLSEFIRLNKRLYQKSRDRLRK